MSPARRVMLTLALTLGGASCSEPAPMVEVSTYVGPSHARTDAEARRESVVKVFQTVLDRAAPGPPPHRTRRVARPRRAGPSADQRRAIREPDA